MRSGHERSGGWTSGIASLTCRPTRGAFRLEIVEGRVSIAGDLDASTSEIVSAAIQATEGRDVVVDLSGVGFVDSSGLRALTSEHRRLTEEHGTLRVIAGRTVRRTIDLAGLTDVLSVTEA